jgi:tetratricopeptide (TPR) repeat protein
MEMRFNRAARAVAALVLSTGLLSTGGLQAAESSSATTYAKQAQAFFEEGSYKQSAKAWENAVKLDSANPDYRDGLGKAYERMAEQSSFPMFLTTKARRSFIRALELQPDHVGAMQDLIDMAQQPIGLCEGNLTEASALIDRLGQVDPQAAHREREYWTDAKQESRRPGQRLFCGPEKVLEVVKNRVIPQGALKAQAPTAPADVLLARRNEQDEEGQ